MADAPKLLGTDTLRTAYPKVNMAIDNANEALSRSQNAENIASIAENFADLAVQTANNVQSQLNQIVIEGDSSVEAAQARVDADGNVYTTLKERLDTKETQFANEIGILSEDTTQNKNLINKWNIYAQNGKGLDLYQLPAWFSWQNPPINIFKDNKKFYTDFDVSKFKNISSTTWYISPNGDNTNDGRSESTPFRSFLKAYSMAQDGDTIVFLDGFYANQDFNFYGLLIEKSLNIVAKNSGKVIITSGDTDVIYTKTNGYNYVYQANMVLVNDVVYMFSDKYYLYKKVNSVSECDATPGSWYHDGQVLYVHNLDHSPVNNKITHALRARKIFHFQSTNSNIKVYVEGITVLGGIGNFVITNTAAYNSPELYMKNCKSLFARRYDAAIPGHGFTILGAKYAFMQNCEAGGNVSDGFNYHAQNGVAPKFIEVDCKAYNNGDKTDNSDDSYQGSTCHDGALGIRINGYYYYNRGQNIADVDNGTQSIMLGCVCFNSNAKDGTTWGVKADISCKTGGVKMHIDSCYCFDSPYSLICTTGSSMEIIDTIYEYKGGGGIITELTQ